MLRSFGPSLPASKFEAVFRDCWDAFGHESAWRVAPAAVTALTAIRFLGIKVAALSNADARMHAVLAGKGLTRLFDGVFLSDETGCAKPEPKAYAHAARQLGVALSAMVHVGDDPKEDGEGARDAGPSASWSAAPTPPRNASGPSTCGTSLMCCVRWSPRARRRAGSPGTW